MYKSSRDLIICQQIMFFSLNGKKEDEAKSIRMPRRTVDKVEKFPTVGLMEK